MTETVIKRSGNPNWVKGVSANPAGRPKGSPSVAHYLRTWPAKDHRKLAEMLWKKALAGDRWAIEYLINRLEGTPVATQVHGEFKDIPLILGWTPPNPNGAKPEGEDGTAA